MHCAVLSRFLSELHGFFSRPRQVYKITLKINREKVLRRVQWNPVSVNPSSVLWTSRLRLHICGLIPLSLPNSLRMSYGPNRKAPSSKTKVLEIKLIFKLYLPTGLLALLIWTEVFLLKSKYQQFSWAWVTPGTPPHNNSRVSHRKNLTNTSLPEKRQQTSAPHGSGSRIMWQAFH